MRSIRLLVLNSIGVLIVTLVAILVWNQLLIDSFLYSLLGMEIFLWDLVFSILSVIILCVIDIILIYQLGNMCKKEILKSQGEKQDGKR